MPSAHGPIFCRKEHQEKVGLKSDFLWSESAHTNQLFIADKTSDPPYDFLSECHLAHTTRFFIRIIVLDNGRRGPIVISRHS